MKRLGYTIRKYITYEFSDKNRDFFVIFEFNKTNKLYCGFLVINGTSKWSALCSHANYKNAIDIYKNL